MRATSQCHRRRSGRKLALLLACAVAAVLACAGPALAAPGLVELPQIGLPTGRQSVGAVAVHGGAAYAAVIERSRDGVDQLLVRRFDRANDAWLPVAGRLSNVDTDRIFRVSFLSVRAGALYVAWTERGGGAVPNRAVVARLTPDGGGWERIMETPLQPYATVQIAQVGDQAWVAWNRSGGGVRLARITAGHVDTLAADTLPRGAWLEGVVGYHNAAFVAYTEAVNVPAHRDNETGLPIPANNFNRLRVARLTPVAGPAGVQLTEIGYWNDAGDSFLTAGTPDAPARPILAWTTPHGIEVIRLRADGFDQIPVARLISLRRIRVLRGLTATLAGITIAATNDADANVRVYTLTGGPDPDRLAITDGDPLPRASQTADVMLVPVPLNADPGALILGYDREAPLRAAAMRYSP